MRKNILKFSLIILTGIVIICNQSCSKDEGIDTDIQKNNTSKLSLNSEDAMWLSKNVSPEMIAFCNQLDIMDPITIKKTLNNIQNSHHNQAKSQQYWGIGLDNTVWKYNGSSWFQPNSAARLSYVELSSYGGSTTDPTQTGVWGIGPDNRVWRWNGSSWFQPNSAARLYAIAPWDCGRALGIGNNGTLFITENGGASWSYFGSKSGFVSITVGNSFNIWGITCEPNLSNPFKLWQYNIYSYQWDYKSTPVQPLRAAAMYTEGVYFFENVVGASRVFKTIDGVNFTQPNPAARVYRSISAAGNDVVCAIGATDTPVNSINGGASWGYLNPAARLSRVSAGYE